MYLCAFRSISLSDRNILLHEELSQSEQVILCLREDLKKVTSEWTTFMKDIEQRQVEVCFVLCFSWSRDVLSREFLCLTTFRMCVFSNV